MEKTFTNDQYKCMKRVGLERVIEDEKERADRQSLLQLGWEQVTPEF